MANGSSTQKFVPFKEVRDGIVVLKDGSMRAAILASSINFALKSGDEQQAILRQFQSFLNTLDFSLQIYVQSRELDIEPYLELLRSREPEQDNELMKIQLREYIDFVKNFTEQVDIMVKSFFVVVPYSPAKIDVSKGWKQFLKRSQKNDPALAKNTFEEHRTQIEQRIALVEQGLNRVGVRTAVLGTDEIIELFYHLFNPGETNVAPNQEGKAVVQNQ